MNTYIPTKDELNSAIREAVKQAVSEVIPSILQQSQKKPFLSKRELKELTGWSDSTIQNLRDTRQIPYTQHGRKILYPYNGIMDFLNKNHIKPLRG